MGKPQSPELRRSGNIAAFDPDNVAARVEAADRPGRSGPTGPVPPENQPGHHPEHEQSKPDMDAFVERFNRAGHDDDERAADEQTEADTDGRTSDGGPSGSPLHGTASQLRAVVDDQVAPRVRNTLGVLAGAIERIAERIAARAGRVHENYTEDPQS